MKKFVKKNCCVTFVALAMCAAFALVGCFGKSGEVKPALMRGTWTGKVL